jgi:ADP-ribose pyrophosphatase YjhB (NUDIX family)
MPLYSQQKRFLFAVDCIILGYDGQELKLLVSKSEQEPLKGRWSLVGGFVGENESSENAAVRVLKDLIGLEGLYMEQLHGFSEPNRDTVERTISIAYFALIDIQKYKEQINEDYHPVWFSINQFPELIFDHTTIVELAKQKLRYKLRFICYYSSYCPKNSQCHSCKVFMRRFIILNSTMEILIVSCCPRNCYLN